MTGADLQLAIAIASMLLVSLTCVALAATGGTRSRRKIGDVPPGLADEAAMTKA